MPVTNRLSLELALLAKQLSVSQEQVGFGAGLRVKLCNLCCLLQKASRIIQKPDSSLMLSVLSKGLNWTVSSVAVLHG
jgi:hypothetical protein